MYETPSPGKAPPGKFHQYDKIWRENLHAVMPGLIRKVLKIEAVVNERLPDKLVTTPQREADFLGKITDNEGNIFILHIEIQVRDDPDMAHRMAVYKTLTEQIYRIPVRQYVIYLGEKPSQMPTSLVSPGLQFEYTLLSLAELPYELFLYSDTPEEKLLAILADFGSNDSLSILLKLIEALHITPEDHLSGNRYLRHLRVFAQLRNLVNQLENAMESVSTFFREENDVFFRRGEKKGEKKGELQKAEKVVGNLLKISHLTDEQIAEAVEVPVAYVTGLRRKVEGE